jgi:hypothetical protein
MKYGHIFEKYNILIGKSKGKRPLGRPKRRWKDIIMDLREMRCEGVGWLQLDQERDEWCAPVSTVMKLRVP